MMQEQSRQQPEQKMTMYNREKVELTGVTEVISFDSKEAYLETTQGVMRFAGDGLHVKRLTLEKGEVALEGRIDEVSYHESQKDKSAGSIFGRLFR